MSLAAQGKASSAVMAGPSGDMWRISPGEDNAEEPSADDKSIREKIKSRLEKYDVGSRYTHIPLPKASILLPLLIKQGKLHLLLTVRSMQLKTMPGDVCFPGGRQEHSEEDDIQTALREAQEEIGLCPEQVEIVGKLVPTFSRSPKSMVTPVVGIVESTFQPTLNPDEVADAFLVPLEFFVSTEDYAPMPLNIPPFGSMTVHKFFYVDAETKKRFTIWGLTAYCALMLSVILLEKEPSFNLGYDLEMTIQYSDLLLQTFSKKGKL
ncbi:peroxisomal coenzyme A diphosphatase NUDT7 isoform X1 [Ranitomeya variabilis]|uniref:peroxisomal coenzyme A diphosphatase NUDT7 isoform X1 n=1 Tax=Ranitomeya variabilis TaxID=490064 RepID=UPI004057A54B